MKERICAVCGKVIPPSQITNNRQKTHNECRKAHYRQSDLARAARNYPSRRWPGVKGRLLRAGYDVSLDPPSKDIQKLLLDGVRYKALRRRSAVTSFRRRNEVKIGRREETIQELSLDITPPMYWKIKRALGELTGFYEDADYDHKIPELLNFLESLEGDSPPPHDVGGFIEHPNGNYKYMVLCALSASFEWGRYLRKYYLWTPPGKHHEMHDWEYDFWPHYDRPVKSRTIKHDEWYGNFLGYWTDNWYDNSHDHEF